MTSLLAGHCVPSRSNCLFGLVVDSSGEHAGGNGLFSGPPTGVSSPMMLNDWSRRLFRPDLEQPTDDDVAEVLGDHHALDTPWVTPSDVSHAVQEVVEARGFGVVRSLVGHGVGRSMHEDPQIPNYGPPGRGPKLAAGMVFAIEPMITAGGYDVEGGPDGWAVFTRDGSLAAHCEHTVAVTSSEPRILTRREPK